MKLYFAGAEADIKRLSLFGVKKILIAYPAFSTFLKNNTYHELIDKFDLFLDSGAFSVFTGKKTVNLDEMIRDYKTLDSIKLKCGLDVIGDAEATKRNCLEMKEANLDVMPTFHYGESFEYLEYYCQNFSYVALDGVAQLKVHERLEEWLDSCFAYIKPYFNKVKIHGFAITSYRLLMRYPFYSVDSTTWQSSARFAEHNELKKLRLRRVKSPYLHRDRRLEKNVSAILDLEKFITDLWKMRGIDFSDV